MMTGSQPQPKDVHVEFEDGTTVPLFAVYVGKQPADGRQGSPTVDTWTLWGDPNLEQDIEIPEGGSFRVRIDVIPGNSQVVLQQEHHGLITRIPRHPG